jgi:hypothetical protein
VAFYLCIFPYYSTWLLVVGNQSILASGRILNTFSFTSTIASLCVGVLIRYTGHYKYFVTFGSCIYLLGIGLLYNYRAPGVPTGTLVGLQIAMGIGGGMLNVPAQLGVQAVSRHQDVAMATSLFLTLLELGGAVGQAISGAVWSSTLEHKLALYLPEDVKINATTIYTGLTLQYQNYPVGTPARSAIDQAINDTMKKFMIGAIITAASLIPLSLLLKDVKLAQVDQKVRGTVIGDSSRGAKSTESFESD